MYRQPRPRREISKPTLTLLRPFFRYSISRDAYVLRGVGNRVGPVLRLRAAIDSPGDRAAAA